MFIDSEDGTSALVLRTHPANVRFDGYDFNVTSGRVDTMNKVNISYGRLEISAKLQNDAAASGVHTAHWLLGYDCWPVGAEVDIMEMQSPGSIYADVAARNCSGTWAKATSNYHLGLPGAANCGRQIPHHRGTSSWPASSQPSVNFTSSYTTFVVEWNATDLVYFVVYGGVGHLVNHVYNGMPGWTNGTAQVPTWPMYLILSQAYMRDRPCGDPPAWAWPVTQRIDYVRLYEKVG